MKRRDFLHATALAFSAALLRAQAVDRPLTVVVIGHTGQGNYGHGEDAVWLRIPQTKIVAVADADPKGLAIEAKKLGGVKAFADYRLMLAAAKGTKVKFIATGEDAPAMLAEIEALFAKKFDEA